LIETPSSKNYALRFRDKAVKRAGIPVMDDAKIGRSKHTEASPFFDVENVKELREKYPKAKQSTIL
jgi:hypothetical protein